jgi:phage I-like protein
MTSNDTRAVGILSAEFQTPAGEFQIFPSGRFSTSDGRPRNAPGYVLDETIAARLITDFKAKTNPLMVDYEHQAILCKENGKPAPAAGWVHGLEWRPGKGLFAVQVEWTDAARDAILKKEYRYVSPVFTYAPKTGVVERIFNVALTNTPALDGMEAAVAHSLALAPEDGESDETRLETLRREIAKNQADLERTKAELETLIAAKQSAQAGHEALKSRLAREELERVIEGYLEAGKLTPAEKDAALTLARHDLASVRKMLDMRASFFGCQSDRIGMPLPGHKGIAGLTSADLRACELTGRSPEEFAALKAQFFDDAPPASLSF